MLAEPTQADETQPPTTKAHSSGVEEGEKGTTQPQTHRPQGDRAAVQEQGCRLLSKSGRDEGQPSTLCLPSGTHVLKI